MKTIAVIFGGKSVEHDISIITAISAIIKPLELLKKYKVEAVYIDKNGTWFWDDKLKSISLYQSGEIDDFRRRAPKVHLLFDSGLTLVKSSSFAGRKAYRKIDVVFPAMHGTHGENGELMGILEMAGVPYVGCGVAASAVAMDKILTRQVTGANEVESPKWVWTTAKELTEHNELAKSHIAELDYPLFVKPARLGSSIGITKVSDANELDNALEVAAHYDNRIIIEEAVPNLIEVTLPIMGNEELILAALEQPLSKDDKMFDFETKYLKNGKGGKKMAGTVGSQGYSKIPAEISVGLKHQAEALAKKAYQALDCRGIARVDMLIDSEAEKVYFNEINPLPGSLYAHNWRAAGISGVDLVEKLIELAEENFAQNQRLTTSFSTNFLKQF